MNYRFFELSKKAFLGLCLAVVSGGFFSCTDRYDLDDEGNYPDFLGSSVYDQLKNPDQHLLTGTFNNYVRLIEDLGYAETLGKTGSKTVFPANDEAFARFYQNNTWGVSKYEDLTDAMKKQLLYSSMLDNAILVEMLSNVSYDATSVTQGIAMKHTTGVNVIDSITHVFGAAGLPENNSFWEKFYAKGIDMVMDATRPMMVHFTQEQMTANNITTRGENSDFEVITGSPYSDEEKSAYIFRNKIINADVTCKNGYIHQLQDVLVPPGNIAEMIRTNGESNYFSRMLDRFSAPYYDAVTTNNYNDYAQANNLPLIDSIFQKRYFSKRSQGNASLSIDPNGTEASNLLIYDPGWNTYTNGMTGSNALGDLAAIFVPTDEAMKQYFLPGGSGAFLMEQFGIKENTEENLNENIDSIPMKIVTKFLNNLMKPSFVTTVPSKFDDVMDDASDPMGLTLDVIDRKSDGTYNVKIANNGVAYMLNTVFAPNEYISVSAPALLRDNMNIMNYAIQDGSGDDYKSFNMNIHFYAYLLAMSANYGFYIPTDEAFLQFYIDPTRLKHTSDADPPRALKFYYDSSKSPYVFCSTWKYNPLTGEVGTTRDDSISRFPASQMASQMKDILNYHTVVLNSGETMGTNIFYKTKHGGELKMENGQVGSGGQIDEGLPMSNILNIYNQKNGTSYAIDHVIQAPQKSVFSVISGFDSFSEFYKMTEVDDEIRRNLMFFGSDKMIDISELNKKEIWNSYKTFVNEFGHYGLDYDVKFFNSYNYTVYMPDNDAMNKAYSLGLPTWDDVASVMEPFAEEWEYYSGEYQNYLAAESDPKTKGTYPKPECSAEMQAARDKALVMVNEINDFVRYHFQDNAVYADNIVEEGTYSTACSDTLGIREKLTVTGGAKLLVVTDNSGNKITISAANPAGKLVNQMTRDYVFNADATKASSINTSSFAVVHQVSTPLNHHANTNRYDGLWSGAKSRSKQKAYRRLFETRLYKKYLNE